MKNIKQTLTFPALTLIKSKIPDNIKEVGNAFVAWEQEEKRTKKDIKAKRAEILNLLPPKLAEELKSYGVELPTDHVEVNMSLGNFFFDLYCLNTPQPSAPLAAHVHQKKMQEIAATLDSEEFDLPADVWLAAKQILNDDKKWASSSYSFWVDLPPAKKGDEPLKHWIGLNDAGAKCFNQIINAAVSAVYDEETKEEGK